MGGWDPCNVTEDADLGLRLARYGYRCETITRPTLEDAPEAMLNWGRQRTRWLKGWMQTWLVHMRAPRQLLGEIGAGRFAVAQVLLAGMVVSALANVVFVATLVWIVILHASSGTIGGYHAVLLAIDAFNVVVGYTAFPTRAAPRRARSVLEGGALDARLLAGDVIRGLARALGTLSPAAPLGKDPSSAQAGSPPTMSAGSLAMIAASCSPIAAMSRPS